MVLGGRDPRRHEVIEERVVHGPIAAHKSLPDHDAPKHLMDGARLSDALGIPDEWGRGDASSRQVGGTLDVQRSSVNRRASTSPAG